MTTINLQQSQQSEKPRFSASGGNKGFIFSLMILVVTLLVLAGLKFYIPMAEGKNSAIVERIAAENKDITGLKSLENVVDMQKRLNEIKINLQLKNGKINRPEMTQVLDQLSKELNTGVVVSEFKYNEGKLTVSFSTNSFADVAKQIFSFKKSSSFENIELLSITRKEKNITGSVSMDLKQ